MNADLYTHAVYDPHMLVCFLSFPTVFELIWWLLESIFDAMWISVINTWHVMLTNDV